AEFEAAFPYEDTPDQVEAAREIKEDMERAVPMDRLLCGDVGYGKTEVAMRAAFKAVMGGKQVAFLAPTTILAEQHYETCLERFKNFPVSIAMLSRFVSKADQKKILEKLKNGAVDIIIGTHKIIQKDMQFKNLGLMIIAEEQRFGVKDKERLKVLKNNIDCLAMSATPIPRTLHMSFLKIRDMSLLTTPPQNRQAIETVIDPYNDDRVAQAIRAEVDRGGQVFYLHNRVESLEETKRKLERLVPEMLIDTAHGQMTSEELDDIFRRFKNGGFQVLVATTIIENGIDIPNVNTIIIDRADMYGVSQLYQLRGRVGRSDRKAYAYMFYPENKALSEVAMKRLQVISDFTELGSGFKIAMKDLELRGAGNLLGRDQSGNVYSVGFDLYLRLLNEAVERLTAQKEYVPQNEVLLELDYTGFIPDTYVSNPQVKMEIYKKIAGVISRQELDSVYSELCDRFGPVPEEVESLLTLAEIKVVAGSLSISSIKEKQGVARVEFSKVSDISVEKLMNL
ncbi:MAG: transcription-repair coupling factor, partial [Treponema sp.]|nr:transcription-repair coupling factor [Treponema sp.]